jgi:hypothetical protein
MTPSRTNENDRLVEIAGKSIPLGFGLNRCYRFAASEKQIVSLAGFQEGFTDRDSRSSGEIGLGSILNNPAGLLEEKINLLSSPLFGGHIGGRPAGSGTEKSRRVDWNRRVEGRDCIGITPRKYQSLFHKF